MKKVFVKVIMQDIELRNCAGLCSHQFCGSPYEKFCNLTLNSMPLHLALCGKHAEALNKDKKGVEVMNLG